MKSKGFNKAGVSFWELVTETYFRIKSMSILTEYSTVEMISGFSTGTIQ